MPAMAATAASDAGQAVPQGAKTLTFIQTARAIREQLQDPQTMKVFKGLAMKYGPDLAMPALFSVPVVGWGAGCAAMPFAWWFGRKGEKIVETEKAHLTKENPVRYALKIQKHWNERPEGLTDKLAKNYNRLVEKLFHKDCATTDALRRTLHMTPGKRAYGQLDRLVQAREAFLRCKLLSLPLKPLDWLYRYIPILPRFIKMVALFPKFGLIGLFYLLGIRPPVR